MALTDTFIKQVKYTGKAAGDKYADAAGMFLHVKAAGKYWRMDYRHGDKRKTLALGVYPAVSLAKARAARDKARELLATLRRVESRGAIDTTHRVKSILSTVFRYAIATGRAVRNPAADVGVALKTTVKGHHPAITEPQRFAQMLRGCAAWVTLTMCPTASGHRRAR